MINPVAKRNRLDDDYMPPEGGKKELKLELVVVEDDGSKEADTPRERDSQLGGLVKDPKPDVNLKKFTKIQENQKTL